jgi:hypothetical protein
MAIKRTSVTKANPKPVANARLRKPDGSTYVELPNVPFDASKEGETRTINAETGYASIVRKIN